MNAQNDAEIWQVEVNGEIYHADFAELTSWVAGGAWQPADKIRRGNLRWIEAGKVPVLTAFFNAKATGQPPLTVSVSEAEPPVEETPTPIAESFTNNVGTPSTSEPELVAAPRKTIQQDPSRCAIHPDVESYYTCLSCDGKFCRACPSGYGGSVKICPSCGGLCKAIAEIQQAYQTHTFHAQAVAGGFGFSDFGAALTYPFKFKTSLIFGALM